MPARHFQLPSPPYRPPQVPSSYLGPVGRRVLVLWRKHHPPFLPYSPTVGQERDPAGDSVPLQDQYHFCSRRVALGTWRGWSQTLEGPWPGAPTRIRAQGHTMDRARKTCFPQGSLPEWVLGQPDAPSTVGRAFPARREQAAGARRSLTFNYPTLPPTGLKAY